MLVWEKYRNVGGEKHLAPPPKSTLVKKDHNVGWIPRMFLLMDEYLLSFVLELIIDFFWTTSSLSYQLSGRKVQSSNLFLTKTLVKYIEEQYS